MAKWTHSFSISECLQYAREGGTQRRMPRCSLCPGKGETSNVHKYTLSEIISHSPECREGSKRVTWAENLEQQEATVGCQRRTQWPWHLSITLVLPHSAGDMKIGIVLQEGNLSIYVRGHNTVDFIQSLNQYDISEDMPCQYHHGDSMLKKSPKHRK